MVEFTKVRKVMNKERSSVLPPSNSLPAGKTVELAKAKINLKHKPSGVLLYANVNWSATFNDSADGSWAETTFELLRDGSVIYHVHQSAIRGESKGAETSSATVFRNAVLRYFDTVPAIDKIGKVTYTLRATNIIVAALNGEHDATTTVNAGAVILTAQQIEACLPDNEQAAD